MLQLANNFDDITDIFSPPSESTCFIPAPLSWCQDGDCCCCFIADLSPVIKLPVTLLSNAGWAFQQQSSRTFYMSDNMDGSAVPIGRRLTMYSFPELAPIGSATITGYAVSRLASMPHSPLVKVWTVFGHAQGMQAVGCQQQMLK